MIVSSFFSKQQTANSKQQTANSKQQTSNKTGYIGLKITTDAQYSLFTPSDRYFVIPQQKEEIADRPSLAFSGNNDVNLGSLYAAFSQTDGSGVMPITNYIGYKSIPWTRLSYRPAAVNELNVLDIQDYPIRLVSVLL